MSEDRYAARGWGMTPFVALDFETANHDRSSVCAMSLVRVFRGRIVRRFSTLVKPDTTDFRHRRIHGIGAKDVANAPSFPTAWRKAQRLLRGTKFLVAHNAGFDRSVLRAACERAGLPMPTQPFRCTVKEARRAWTDLDNHKLPTLADYLGLDLQHHDAQSDALACANIMLRVLEERSLGAS